MAFAEARAVWQRASNRCFVQQDAKRAPKLACSSSSTTSAKEAEIGPSSGQKFSPSIFVPFDQETSYYNLSPSSKWWLQMQPKFECYRGLMDEKPTVMDSDETDFVMVDQSSVDESVLDEKFSVKELNRMPSNEIDFSVHHAFSMEENCRKGQGIVESFVSSNDALFDFDSSWSGSEKSGPWWKTDADELVSQRSLNLVENCDLPLPQDPYSRKTLSAKTTYFSHCETFTPSNNQNLVQLSGLFSSNDSTERSIASGISSQKHESKFGEIHEEFPKSGNAGEDTAQLLEALRHSQTRAREFEKAAKEACAEKEHIIKLLLTQASHIFAYKQWLKLVQLENNRTLHVNKSAQPSISYPTVSHFRSTKNHRKSAAKRHFHKYAIAFALGFRLISAGLILGWSIAWIIPSH